MTLKIIVSKPELWPDKEFIKKQFIKKLSKNPDYVLQDADGTIIDVKSVEFDRFIEKYYGNPGECFVKGWLLRNQEKNIEGALIDTLEEFWET